MNQRALRLLSFLICAGLLGVAACVSFHPVQMDSDPNQLQQKQQDEKIDGANLEAFIAAHPELDSQTKKELRAGVIDRKEALRRHPEATTPSPVSTAPAK